MKKKLLSLGHGYSAQVFEKFLDPKIWEMFNRTAAQAKRWIGQNTQDS